MLQVIACAYGATSTRKYGISWHQLIRWTVAAKRKPHTYRLVHQARRVRWNTHTHTLWEIKVPQAPALACSAVGTGVLGHMRQSTAVNSGGLPVL